MEILTTRGPMDAGALVRVVGVEDRPAAIVLWVEWRLPGIEEGRCVGELVRRDAYRLPTVEGDPVHTAEGMIARAELERTVLVQENDREHVVAVEWRRRGKIVRRDANVVLKQASVEARAVAAALG